MILPAASTEVFLILDGVFAVEADGEPVAEIGPGAVVGKRAALGGGLRTATLRATTKPGRGIGRRQRIPVIRGRLRPLTDP